MKRLRTLHGWHGNTLSDQEQCEKTKDAIRQYLWLTVIRKGNVTDWENFVIYLVQLHWQIIQPVRPRAQRTSPWKSSSGCPRYGQFTKENKLLQLRNVVHVLTPANFLQVKCFPFNPHCTVQLFFKSFEFNNKFQQSTHVECQRFFLQFRSHFSQQAQHFRRYIKRGDHWVQMRLSRVALRDIAHNIYISPCKLYQIFTLSPGQW